MKLRKKTGYQQKLTPIALSIVLGISGLTVNPVRADGYMQGSVLSDNLFYSIGGGAAIMPPTANRAANTYSLGLGWSSNLMCGNFDLKTSVKNQLNGLTEGFKDLFGNVIESAQGAVASLPAMIIQRANPQLYDILSNGLYQAKIDFNNLKTDCETMSNQLADRIMGNKWNDLAKLENYKDIVSTSTDPKIAKKQMEQDGGKKGVQWIGGEKKGGQNQGRIEVIYDSVLAGYNVLLGRKATDKSNVPTVSCDGMLCSEWKSPEDAAEWVRDVLGDKTLSTCTDCGTPAIEAKAGTGLAPKIEKETIKVMANFQETLNSASVTNEQLSKLGSTTVPITRSVIEALKEDPDAAVLATRLSNEVAISRNLEKALMARRMLLAGMREPNVTQNTDAMAELERNLTTLDREITQVKMEMDLQRSINQNTIIAILNNRTVEQQRALTSNASDNSDIRIWGEKKEKQGNVRDSRLAPVERPINMNVPTEESGLSGFYGSYNATPSGNSSSGMGYSGTGNYNSIPPLAGAAIEQATALLKNFEGFSSKAYWDVNAYRTGYGSDTITKADGTVVKVTKDTVITREDAERDLARRTQEFANRAKNQVSSASWDALPANAQAALTSYAYNYGSLTDDVRNAAINAAKTGDMTALANAVRNRQTNNNGVNAKRRNQEADYILGKS